MSRSLVVVASITRANVVGGPLADLDLNDGTSYKVVSAGPGSRQWVWDWAAAPAVHGEQPVSGRMGNQIAPVAIRALGTTAAQLDTRSKALVAAFSQIRFQLTITIDGKTSTWKCFAANGAPADSTGNGSDGSWDKDSLAEFQQVYAFQIPRLPVPVAGVM